MKVIKISGNSQDIDIIKNSEYNILEGSAVFILDENKLLYEFVEKINVDSKLLYNLKIANDVYFFGIPTVFCDKITGEKYIQEVTSLSHLLENANFEQLRDGSLIFNCEEDELIFKVKQSLVYLDIDLDVMSKKEKDDKQILDAFRKKYEKLRCSISSSARELQNLGTLDEFVNEKSEFIDNVYGIEVNLEEARERELNVAVMATKKAGKSVIVNSFLDEQYAPTSLELPTPNNCIYKRSKDNTIRILYGNNNLKFKRPEDVYDYLYSEFKKAQNDKASGYTLEDMEIHYPSKGNGIGDFTLIDTPGSNYVAAKRFDSSENIHKKLAYKWIDKSDVILFLINYSNYLTEDEEEFLRNIKKQFEEQKKFYSLIIVVNKLDEMYISEIENKSVARFLDYIRNKLYELGYNNFIVLGTSARTYYDVINTIKIDKELSLTIPDYQPIEKLKNNELRARLKILKSRFVGQAEMSSLSFVDEQLERFECFHGIQNYNLEILREKSGIPKLRNYTSYVGMQKANVELYRNIIRKIDEKYIKISNKSKITRFMASKEENFDKMEEFQNMINQVMGRINVITGDIGEKLNFEQFKSNLLQRVKHDMDDVLDHMLDIGEARIDEYFMKLLLKTSEELKDIKNQTREIEFSINKKLFISEINHVIERAVAAVNSEILSKEDYVRQAEKNMRQIVENFSYAVRREYSIKDFDITVPKINHEFKKNVIFNMPQIDINDSVIQEKIRGCIEFKETGFQGIFNSFRKEKQGTYFLNSEKLRRVNVEYIESIRCGEYNEYYEMIKYTFSNALGEHVNNLVINYNDILNVYESIFSDLLGSMESVKEKSEKQITILDRNIDFYNSIESIMSNFNESWEEVRKA